jgi:hypothetical protein
MVLVPKAAAALAPSSVTQTRVGPPTRVASFSPSVEQLNGIAGPSFNPPSFGNTEEGRPSLDRDTQRRAHQNTPGVFSAPSQTFAAILESGDQLFGVGGGNVRSSRFGGLVSKAIEIYENNAKVVTGTNNILGTSVSLVL